MSIDGFRILFNIISILTILCFRCYGMIRKDPKASVLAIYNMAKTQIVDEYFPIKDDHRNKSLKEEFLQNVRSYHNIQSSSKSV